MVSDRLLTYVNALEAWLERSRSRAYLLPVRLVGHALLVIVLMTSNLVALIRWPFAALLGADAPAAGTPHTPHEATQPHPSPGKPVAVDAEALNDLIGSGQPVLVDFWAAWCGPCIAMNPSLHRVADDMGRACVVAKVDTMKHQPVAEAHGVKGLPTLVLFVDGEEAERHAGALSYVGLRSLLERHLPEHAFPA